MIIVLTYGKVFTTSLAEMLSARFPGDVFVSHALQPFFPKLIQEYDNVATVDLAGLHLSFSNHTLQKRLEIADRQGETITFVSGVRDPITRSLSVAMQVYGELFRDPGDIDLPDDQIAGRIAAEIADLWQHETANHDPRRRLAEATVRIPLTWLQQELVTPFGFDVFGSEFNKDDGYSIFTQGNKRLLLFRYENGPGAVERGLGDLFQGHDFHLPHANGGDAKQTGAIYRHLRQSFRLPRTALETIYGHPATAHFYRDDEIAAAIDQWADDTAEIADVSAPSVPAKALTEPLPAKAARKATVLIPLYNNAAYVGALLDSIFNQWRPDLELLVVDDASTDGGLDIVLQKLATRPDIAATVLRHETNCVHATLADVAKHASAVIIIQADSDDVMLPGRIDRILREFDDDARCRLVTSNALMISDTGLPLGLYDTDPRPEIVERPNDTIKKWGSRWIGATSAFHRSLIEAYAPFDPQLCPYGFDMLTPLRATLLGTHHHLAEPLVAWRQHRNNSHRLIGVLSNDIQYRERLLANEIMVYAQCLRDVKWIQDHRYSAQPDVMDEALALSEALFFQRFEAWARLRSELQATPRDGLVEPTDQRGVRPPLGVPTIMTVLPGQRYRVCAGSPISNALASWGGFHHPEEKHIWTSRHTAFALRIPSADVRGLAITLGSSAIFAPRKAYISINFAGLTVVDLPNDSVVVEVPLKQVSRAHLPWGEDLCVVTIHVPDAEMPMTVRPDYPDARILGAALYALQPVAH